LFFFSIKARPIDINKLTGFYMKIKLCKYDSKWPLLFKKEVEPIRRALGDNCIELHHIGSTSIPGLIAKPKIDILAVVKDFSSIDISSLEKIGFENGGEIIKTGRYFSKRIPFKVHLHIFEEGNPIIEKDLKFRDYLRSHREDRDDYAKHKIELAAIHDDGMCYCRAKTDFITNILSKIENLIKNNNNKFSEVKKLNLPVDQYAITGSGPMGIRNLKEINDIDIIVTSKLWNDLALKHPIVDQNNVKKIVIPNSLIEIFCETSFYTKTKEKDEPNVAQRIGNSEIIDGLPFESLKNTLFYKYKMGREKDLKDIEIIESWLNFQ
jgi:GrpB-like predicted nucleotidyltransferase (UPF0157 family)